MSQNQDVFTDNNEIDNQISDSSIDYLQNSKVQELHQAFQKFKTFLKQISTERNENFEKDIKTYSGKGSILSKSPEQILRLCQKRIQKMLRNKKTKKNWNQDDIEILVWVLNKYTSSFANKSIHSFEEADWKFVSSLIPATSSKKCMFKWLSLKKFSLLTFRWSSEESQLLANLIKQNGKKDWKKLAQKLYIANNLQDKVFRTPKQCRQHWNCYLNPSIKKGPWSIKEDIKLLESVLQLNCMKKWSEVAKGIKGRTQNAVKNRFTLLLQKQKRLTGQQNEKHLINRVLVKLMHQQTFERTQIKSNQIQDLEAPNLIFQQSEDSQNMKNLFVIKPQLLQRKKSGAQQMQKSQEKCTRKIIIPTVIQNQTIYHQPQYFPISPEFTPYFFNFMYGGHYSMN